MTREQAAALVRKLLGSYPSLNLHDPESYIAGVVQLLCGYPLWAGERAAEKAGVISKFIPPTRGQLYTELEAQIHATRYAIEWERRANSDAKLLEAPPPSPEERERMAEGFKDLIGKLKGGPDKERAERADRAEKAGLASVAHSNAEILAEYESAGLAPIYTANGMLISLELARFAQAVKAQMPAANGLDSPDFVESQR